MEKVRHGLRSNLLFTVFPAIALVILSAREAGAQVKAQSNDGRFVAGLSAGASFSPQDICSGCNVRADAGAVVSGDIMYGLSKNLLIGLNGQWENHNISTSGVILGDLTTVSLIPTLEIHLPTEGSMAPYLTAGLGVNFNSFRGHNTLNNACTIAFTSPCSIKPEDTFALRLGGGLEYFVSSNVTLSGEVAWKMNSGQMEVSVAGVGSQQDQFQSNTVSLLFGIRFYFK